MTFNTLPKFAGALFKWISRIGYGLLVMLAFNSTTLAVDVLYVSMSDNTVITYDTTGSNGENTAATRTTFASTYMSTPYGLAFDISGNLYAANYSGGTVSKFDSFGRYLSSIVTNLPGPTGLAFDSTGNLYAANYGPNGYSLISKFDSSGVYQSGFDNRYLSAPWALAFDSTGNLYVANASGGRVTISKFDSSGQYVSRIVSSNLGAPAGLAFDSTGNLYVANDSDASISKFDSSGEFLSSIYTNLKNPWGLAFDSIGNLYVANYTGFISKFDSTGNFLSSWSTGLASPRYLAFKPVSVPEPSTYALATIATGVMAYLARRRKSRTA